MIDEESVGIGGVLRGRRAAHHHDCGRLFGLHPSRQIEVPLDGPQKARQQQHARPAGAADVGQAIARFHAKGKHIQLRRERAVPMADRGADHETQAESAAIECFGADGRPEGGAAIAGARLKPSPQRRDPFPGLTHIPFEIVVRDFEVVGDDGIDVGGCRRALGVARVSIRPQFQDADAHHLCERRWATRDRTGVPDRRTVGEQLQDRKAGVRYRVRRPDSSCPRQQPSPMNPEDDRKRH